MIKINLLPKDARKRVGIAEQIFIIVIALILTCVVIGFVWNYLNGVIEQKTQQITQTQQRLDELKKVITENCKLPVILIGYSWGAWLSFILTANYPSLIKKLILVGSGPFESKYSGNIMDKRLSRLEDKKRKKVNELILELNNIIIG